VPSVHRSDQPAKTFFFPKSVAGKKITLVTGRSAGPVLEKFLLPALQATERLTVHLAVITNRFFGKGVTVSAC